jgi:hypothetical protein
MVCLTLSNGDQYDGPMAIDSSTGRYVMDGSGGTYTYQKGLYAEHGTMRRTHRPVRPGTSAGGGTDENTGRAR